jgi:hypothetical protein
MLNPPNKDHSPLRQVWDILTHIQVAISNLQGNYRSGNLGSSYLMQIVMESLGGDLADAKKRLEALEGFEPRTPAYVRHLEDLVLTLLQGKGDMEEIPSLAHPDLTSVVLNIRQSIAQHQVERAG